MLLFYKERLCYTEETTSNSHGEDKTKLKYWNSAIEHTIICVDWIKYAHRALIHLAYILFFYLQAKQQRL